MVFKNLLRRKVRTLLTILGIGLGVAAIIGLGALADGLQLGYGAMLGGSKADLVISQPNSFDISYSSVDESIYLSWQRCRRFQRSAGCCKDGARQRVSRSSSFLATR
jgi:ABC-type lipoprotein release transport system permease subunit